MLKKSTNINIIADTSLRNTISSLWKQRYLQAMGLPGVIWMFVFCYIPMYGILMAFTEYDIIKPIIHAPWVGLKYLKEFVEDEKFFPIIQNTLGISFFKLIIGFPLPIIFALLLNELSSIRFKRVVQTITYLPHFLSWAVLGGIMINWFSDIGIFNDMLTKIGIISEPIYYLAEPQYFWGLAVGSDIWKETGWNAIIYLAAISGVDQQLYESSELDGAGRLQKIWHITLPCISGTIAIIFILSCGYLMNTNFDQILVLTNQLNLDRSNVIDLFIYRTGIQTGRYSFATAAGLFRSVIALVLLVMANRATKKLTGQTLY